MSDDHPQEAQSQAQVFDLLSFATSVRGSNKATSRAAKRRREEQQQQQQQVQRQESDDHVDHDNAVVVPHVVDDDEPVSLRVKYHIKVHRDTTDDDDNDDNDDANTDNLSSVPEPIDSFDTMASQFGWPAWLVNNLTSFGFSAPTPIQMQAIPIMMGDHDLFAYSQTGSGKTLAFLLPILARLRNPMQAGARAVVLCPTRELAQQIFSVILRLTKGTAWQTLLVRKQVANGNFVKLANKFDLLVSTPFRLSCLVAKGYSLAAVEHVVLDEADRLFDTVEGAAFVKQIDLILAACSHAARRCWLFSATRVETAEELARSVLHEPIRVVIGAQNRALGTVAQRLVYTGDERGKLLGLWQMIRGGVSTPMLVFVQSQERAIELARELRVGGVRAAALHSGCTQQERDEIVTQFRIGEVFVIVATDVLSRGIDYSAVKCVVNYDVPLTRTSYIHRVGRTGRAGRDGEAVTFCAKRDRDALRIIASVMRESGNEVPDWIFKLPNPNSQTRKKMARYPIRRDKITKGRIIQNFDDEEIDNEHVGANDDASDNSDELGVYRGDNDNEDDNDADEE